MVCVWAALMAEKLVVLMVVLLVGCLVLKMADGLVVPVVGMWAVKRVARWVGLTDNILVEGLVVMMVFLMAAVMVVLMDI